MKERIKEASRLFSLQASLCTDPQFQELQKSFMEKYWNEFDDNEENKLVYMDIFKEYVSIKIVKWLFEFYGQGLEACMNFDAAAFRLMWWRNI